MIEKLSDSWSDYKNNLKHKTTNFTIEEIVTHTLIEATNKKETFKAKELAFKANLIQGQSSNNKRYGIKSKGYKSYNPNFKKKKGSYFTCGNSSQHIAQ